jgi:hypothetical protein
VYVAKHGPCFCVPFDARKVLAPYFKKLNLNSETISPSAFELLIHIWLTDIARSAEYRAELDAFA